MRNMAVRRDEEADQDGPLPAGDARNDFLPERKAEHRRFHGFKRRKNERQDYTLENVTVRIKMGRFHGHISLPTSDQNEMRKSKESSHS